LRHRGGERRQQGTFTGERGLLARHQRGGLGKQLFGQREGKVKKKFRGTRAHLRSGVVCDGNKDSWTATAKAYLPTPRRWVKFGRQAPPASIWGKVVWGGAKPRGKVKLGRERRKIWGLVARLGKG